MGHFTCKGYPHPILELLEPIDDYVVDVFVCRLEHILGFAAFYLQAIGAAGCQCLRSVHSMLLSAFLLLLLVARTLLSCRFYSVHVFYFDVIAMRLRD